LGAAANRQANPRLQRAAITTAKKIQQADSRVARWIATDALPKLTKKNRN
jgi:hypothetical protein